jgi:hypothetical protein
LLSRGGIVGASGEDQQEEEDDDEDESDGSEKDGDDDDDDEDVDVSIDMTDGKSGSGATKENIAKMVTRMVKLVVSCVLRCFLLYIFIYIIASVITKLPLLKIHDGKLLTSGIIICRLRGYCLYFALLCFALLHNAPSMPCNLTHLY